MGIKGRRVHMIEELSETIISFQRGKLNETDSFARIVQATKTNQYFCSVLFCLCIMKYSIFANSLPNLFTIALSCAFSLLPLIANIVLFVTFDDT